jgi:hypothetical protein
MPNLNKKESARTGASSLADLWSAADDALSDDDEALAESVERLSAPAGRLYLDALHAVHRRAADAGVERTADVRSWLSQDGEAAIFPYRPPLVHASDRIGLEAFCAHLSRGGAQDDRRPTFMLLSWHALPGQELELMPPTALREAFLFLIDGTATITAEGGHRRRLIAGDNAAGFWLGGVDERPWLPGMRVIAEGKGAAGLLILSGEAGVPVVESRAGPVRRPGRSHGTPVSLLPSGEPSRAESFWRALKRVGIKGPKTFRVPKKVGLHSWCATLPSADMRRNVHARAVQDGFLVPKEMRAWQGLRARLGRRKWPSLIFRVLQLPPSPDADLPLDRHNGSEALLAWGGSFTFLLDSDDDADSQTVYVSINCEGDGVERAGVASRGDGDFDLLMLGSDHFHGVGAGEGGAVALHFTTSRFDWSADWRGMTSDQQQQNRDSDRGTG